MTSVTIWASSLAIAVCTFSVSGAEPLRGIELHPDAPDAVVEAFAKSGVNTIVVPFRTQGDLDDPAFVASIARWGKLAKRHRLRCLVAIRLFGPPDYTGAKGGFVRAVEAVAASPCVSPGDTDYWDKIVTPRVARIAQLAKDHALAGGLFDYQATLAGNEYGPMFCFSDVCWNAFLTAKHPGDAKLAKLKGRHDRVNWVRNSTTGGEYYEFLSQLVQGEMAKAVQKARAIQPDVALGVYGYWDYWLYRGVVRALSQAGARPPAVMAEYERISFGRAYPLLKQAWAKASLDLEPVARLPLDYYMPADVQNQIAELDKDKVGFLLTATDSLWRRVADFYHVYAPHGTPEEFASSVAAGLASKQPDRKILFNKSHYVQYMPRLGIVHGGGLSGLFSGLLKRLAESFQLPCLQLTAPDVEKWTPLLSLCNVMIVMPGATGANPNGMAALAPAVQRFMTDGGIVIVLNAADATCMNWLASHNPRFACQGERKMLLKQAWLDNEGRGLLAAPAYIEKLPPMGMHFTSYDKRYAPVAKDDQGGAYLLMQQVGRGTLLLSAAPVVPPELLANIYFTAQRRGDVFNVQLLAGADTVRFGPNRLALAVAELPDTAADVNVFVDVVDNKGRVSTQAFSGVRVGGDGIEIPFDYLADQEGAGRAVVSITDPVDGSLLRREFFTLMHDRRVIVLPDKSYYTKEAEALLRVSYMDTSLVKAHVRVGDKDLQLEGTGDVRFAKLTLADLALGENPIDVTFVDQGKIAYKRTVPITKHPPFPTAVKTLYHRSCTVEVDGKPFFPFGCYGGEETVLADLGANSTVSGRSDKDGRLRFCPHKLTAWTLDDQWTPEKVRQEIRGDEYKMLLAWYNFDEPALNSQSSDYVRKHYDAGRRKDPYHPQMIVYVGSQTYPLYPDYMTAADWQGMDHYPLPYFAPKTFASCLAKVAEAARGTKTVWGVAQCFDWRESGAGIGPYRKEDLHPRGPEALSYVYQAVIEGAGAFHFWTYRYVASDPARLGDFHKAIAEGAKVTQLVARGAVVTPPRVNPLSAQVKCRAFRIGDEIYIVAANYLEQPADVTFQAPYLQGKTLRQHLPEARQLTGLSDHFEPLQGKVYIVASR
ncbi:MAG: hypothetical protein JXQ73_19060 [Phycisphaerae bacterium]|nr:hypothetical protein [Phycisphaerae bacterium]